MGKGISLLKAMKAHVDMDAKVHIYTAIALGRCRKANPTLGRLYPREITGTHFPGG